MTPSNILREKIRIARSDPESTADWTNEEFDEVLRLAAHALDCLLTDREELSKPVLTVAPMGSATSQAPCGASGNSAEVGEE